MHLKTYFGVFLLSILVVSSFAKNHTKPDQIKKELIIRSINLMRAAHKQPAITFAGIYRQTQSTSLKKAATGGSISGKISGVSDRDVQLLSVVAWDNSSDPADSTGTDTAYFGEIKPDGSYIISSLNPGEYYVMATADNYIPIYYNNVSDFIDAITLPVTDGETIQGIDFFLEKFNSGQSSLSGKVITQKDGMPIANAYVNVFSPDNSYFYGWTVTAEDGTYEIIGMTSGKYFAYVWADGYLNEYYKEAESFDQATAIDVVEPNTYSEINFSMSRGGMISGLVSTENGKPLSGIYVQAYSDFRIPPDFPQSDSIAVINEGYGAAVTEVDGSYLITGLSEGDYLVSAQMWNQWIYIEEFYDNVTDISEATSVAVETEVETPDINFELNVPSTFGSIFGNVVDIDGQPISGVTVQVHAPFNAYSGGLQVWAYGYTDYLGNYRIDNLPDGEYLVSAYAQVNWQYVNRYWPDAEIPEEAEPVVVDDINNNLPIDFQLPVRPGTASISGHVKLDTGVPAIYAYIQLTSFDEDTNPNVGSIRAYASTDSSGNYRIDQLPEGNYVIYTQYWENENFAQQWFDLKDSRSEADAIILTTGEQRGNINFNLTLRPYYGTIAGNVTNEIYGRSVARAYVEITPIGFNYYENGLDRLSFMPSFGWPYYAITNEQGNYQFDWLPEGEYYVSAYTDGAFEYFEDAPVAELATKVKVRGGETSAAKFNLTPRNEGNGIISGKVSDEWNSGELLIAIVIARPVVVPLVWPESEKFFNTITKTDGSYELTGLPAGDYYLFSFSPGYIGEYYDNAYDPSEAKVLKVVENQPVGGIDFTLSPILWMRGCPECDFSGEEGAGGGQVFGKVTDGNGKVIQNATVYLLDNGGKPVSFAQSNAEGMYELRGVPPGHYRIKATHLNFKGEFNNGTTNFADAQVIEVGNGALEINFELNSVTGVKDQSIPKTIMLYGNYPNPFNPETTIKFGLPADMLVRLRIFNLLGQEVRILGGDRFAAGDHAVKWDGRDYNGSILPSGVYFYILEIDGKSNIVQKMILLK